MFQLNPPQFILGQMYGVRKSLLLLCPCLGCTLEGIEEGCGVYAMPIQSHTFYIQFTSLGRGLALASWSQFKAVGQTSKSTNVPNTLLRAIGGGAATRIKEKRKIKYEHNTNFSM